LVNSPAGGASVVTAEHTDLLINLGGFILVVLSAVFVILAIRAAFKRAFQRSVLYALVALVIGVIGVAFSSTETMF
jgi:hypothetical protein